MTLLSSRRRADEFDSLLNGRRTGRTELVELTHVVTALRAHAPVAPRPDFAATLRSRLMAEAADVLTGDATALALPTRRRGTRERRLVVAATTMVFVGGTAGMAAASQGALPGDPLYPIKRGIERAEAGLNTNDAGKGRDLLGQANDRLSEVQGLLEERGSYSAQVQSTVEQFSQQANEGTALLVASFEEKRDPQDIETIRTFAAGGLTTLQEVAKVAPPEAQPALANAAVQLQEIDQRMLSLCSACADGLPPLEVTDLLLSSSGLREAAEAAARIFADDRATVPQGGRTPLAKHREGLKTPTATTQPLPTDTATQPAGQPKAPETATKVRTTTKDVKQTVEETAKPVQDLVDGVVPSVGGLLGPDGLLVED